MELARILDVVDTNHLCPLKACSRKFLSLEIQSKLHPWPIEAFHVRRIEDGL
jgi:hypothetical protein